jgi:ureidoacrylate peracid hydrolase
LKRLPACATAARRWTFRKPPDLFSQKEEDRMHNIDIPIDALARAASFRAERHMFTDLDPSRTAHIVVDLQNGFMEPGAPVEVPVARDIVPNVNRITQALRAAGGTIVYLRFKTDAAALSSWTSFYTHMLSGIRRDEMAAAFGPGSHHFQLWPGLDVQPGEWVVDKSRYSAFVPGTCDLQEQLQAARIETLIVSGTLTNCCCESTARDAMQRNYQVIFVADANAALNDAEHNATLGNMVALFADVMMTCDVLKAIPAAARAEAA